MSQTRNRRRTSTRSSSGRSRQEYGEKQRRTKKYNEIDEIIAQGKGKKATSKCSQKTSSKTKKSQKDKEKFSELTTKQKVIRILLKLLLIICIVLVVLFIISLVKWNNMAKEMIKNTPSIIVDSSGKKIGEIGTERNRKNITFDKMPTDLKDAYVAIEDQRYYKHIGIDVKRTGAAVLNYVSSFGNASFGGSTITQQLVKNLTGNTDTTVSRKVDEWTKAVALEMMLSKEEILEAYLNIIYVGPNVYGVEMGAEYYFSKSASELSLEECAYLAGINHSPNSYNPFRETDNSAKIRKRTITVLAKMKELGYINQEEYDSAKTKVEAGLDFKRGDIEIQKESEIYSYHTDALIAELIKDIAKQKRISEAFATNYLYMANLKVYSTQDASIQDTIEKEFNKKKYMLESINNPEMTSQAAMVIIDHKTGYVLRMCRRTWRKNYS